MTATIQKAIDTANTRIACDVASRVTERCGLNGHAYRVMVDAVYSALSRGTDNGKAIDVLRIAVESVGLPYFPTKWQ